MRFKMPTDFRPLKYPMMVVDFLKALLSGFLLLLVVMSLAAVFVYRAEYTEVEEQAITVTVDEELLNRLDDFQVENELDNRTEAIRSLLNRALTEIEAPTVESSPSEEATQSDKSTSENGPSEDVTEIEAPTVESSPSEEATQSDKSTSENGPSEDVTEPQ